MNKFAWSILTEEERISLSLAHGHSKSTWQAGEIMNKAHYKYIEIKRRAEYFLRTFTEYYDKYPDFWPDSFKFPEQFKEFIQFTMIDRLPLKDSMERESTGGYQIASYRNRQITQILLDMRKSKDHQVIDLYELILEFDRWNNFRILPPKCQMPSAFERRNKTKELKYIKRLSKIPDFTLAKLRERYEYKGSLEGFYVPLFSKSFTVTYHVMKIQKVERNSDEMARLGLFTFTREDQAKAFASLVAEYVYKQTPKKANYGQRFWPLYRTMSKTSHNYREIYQIITTKDSLENAYIDMNLLKTRKKAKEFELGGAKSLKNDEIRGMY